MQKITVLALGLFLACSGVAQSEISVKDKNEISSLLQKQVDAWNKGDLETFMETYWKSDSLVFVGGNGPTFGWQKTLDNYKRRYPTRDEMGQTHFTVIKISRIDKKIVFVIGRYELTREIGDLAGHFTLVIQKMNGKWFIISDHSSAEN